jgi:EAL domain-containing protein (putative c-di-GMP-specific phosphodiesterase class I)
VTESVLLANTEAALLTLRRLKALGIRIAIDDFGTGYSSLSYLRRFPVDLVKIDRSFVEQLGTDEQSATIVEAIIGLAHALDLAVVAEGVETAEHLAALSALGCDLAQGFYFRAAIPKDEFEEFLDEELSRTP